MRTPDEPEPDGPFFERRDSLLGELILRRRKGVFQIIANGVFLMSSENPASEKMLATKGLEWVSGKRTVEDVSVLVGGLGMGCTVSEVLRSPLVSSVTVVELEEQIVKWNRGVLSSVNEKCLGSPRTQVIVADLAEYVREVCEEYDLVLMDTDNGPGWLVREENARLYDIEGLRTLRSALRPGGVAAIWSAQPEPILLSNLGDVFPDAEQHRISVHRDGRMFEDFILSATREVGGSRVAQEGDL